MVASVTSASVKRFDSVTESAKLCAPVRTKLGDRVANAETESKSAIWAESTQTRKRVRIVMPKIIKRV